MTTEQPSPRALAQARGVEAMMHDLLRRTEIAYGHPPEAWRGACYAVATALAGTLADAEAVYGHYRGPVAPDGYFGHRAHLGFIQHGWVLLSEGTVIDPTRWVFENVEPYVYIAPVSDDYDRGGNVLWTQMMGPPPEAGNDEIVLILSGDAEVLALGIFETWELTYRQAHWIAHLPPAAMGAAGESLFRQLIAADLGAWIPIDNRREVLGDA
jgi:hypothetical protein